MEPTEFGQYIKTKRKEKKLTARQLAKQSKVSHSYISQIERGERGVPSSTILRQLHKPLGISFVEIMEKAGHFKGDDVHRFKTMLLEEENVHDTIKTLLEHLTSNGYFYESVQNDIFYLFNGDMRGLELGLDFDYFDQYYSDFLIAKSEAPDLEFDDSDSYGEIDERLDFDRHYNLNTVYESIILSDDLVWKSELAVNLNKLAEKHNLQVTAPDPDRKGLHELLQQPDLKFKTVTLTDDERKQISDYIEYLIHKREGND